MDALKRLKFFKKMIAFINNALIKWIIYIVKKYA